MSDLLPAGTYPAVCVSAELGKAESGTEQVALGFRVTGAPGYEGRGITYYGSFSEKAWPHTIRALRACGWQGEDLSDLSTALWDKTGLGVLLVVEHDEYPVGSGKWRAKVRWVNDPTGGNGAALKNPLSDIERKAFAARMRGNLAAVRNDPHFMPRDLNAQADMAASTADDIGF